MSRDPLTLRDPSGRQLVLTHLEGGAIEASVRFSALIHWSVTVPAKDVERLREWLR